MIFLFFLRTCTILLIMFNAYAFFFKFIILSTNFFPSQKFSSQRQLGNEEIMSDDGRVGSSKFLWFSLASLERMASLQGNLQEYEDLERLDSASALHAKIVSHHHPTSKIISGEFHRGDSGSSHSRYVCSPISKQFYSLFTLFFP